MANDNTTLGRFQLVGIPAAPRGTPQIEVTFDIDSNGIINVSAKDQGTGKEQKITITASNKLSDEEIEEKIKEAEAHAEEDKKRQEEIEIRNTADSLVYTVDKTIEELGEQLAEDKKTLLKDQQKDLQDAIAADDIDQIKEKSDVLDKTIQEIGAEIYQQAAQAQQAQEQAQQQAQGQPNNDAAADDDTIDADFQK